MYGAANGGQDSIFASGFETSYTVSGNVTGLDALGQSIEILLNNSSQLTVSADGPYTTVDALEVGQVYDITIDNNNCTVMNGIGVMPNNGTTNADINCPLAFTTVYDIKQGLATGDVALQNMLVTACKDNFGYNLQTTPNDPDYVGDEYSGIFVFDNGVICSSLQVGDRIDINPATVNVFFDEIQLLNATYSIQSTNNPMPSPVTTTANDLFQNASHPLNGVLVEVQNTTVTGADFNASEFTLDTTLVANDRFYLASPFPTVNEPMSFVRGTVSYHQNLNKINPRSADDLGREKRLVINEVDYDQTGADTHEFIEIYNPGPEINLLNLGVHLVNGTNNQSYDFESLYTVTEPKLEHGDYLVVGSQNVIDALPAGVTGIVMNSSSIQNGPDGLVLVDESNQIIYDVLSYEGEITAADIGYDNPVNLVEGNATIAADSGGGSLSRTPNGQDTDDASADWQLSTTPTPGTSNNIATSDGLVINEVDYDQPGTDAEEFIEIYNPTASSIDLSQVDLVLVNGADNEEYNRLTLSGTLGAGQFAVVAHPAVNIPQGVLSFTMPGSMQNGGPDGLALINNINNTLIDALSYEGAITAAIINGFGGTVSLVEGNPTSATDTGTGSIIRIPDGTDSGDDATDFVNSANPTPGETNIQ